ncbi:hydroxyisourate hydrolase [Polaromonas sp.]|uniref:hydroxyisourate hydrolase n=1 Tax=Polaromonas sp. TaxID=1869339 RepID=UPI00286B8885|nr:hydroxyisourate hydrolase [Polaromonas sp.]
MKSETSFSPAGAMPRRGVLRAGLLMGGAALAPRFAAAADVPAAAPTGLTVAPSSQAGVSPRLTVHAIDSFHGATGAGLRLDLSRFDGERWQLLKTVRANAGGRPAEPLLIGDAYRTGRYEVLLHLDEYFAQMGAKLPQPAFLSKVPLRFVIQDAAQRVHLAALFSPWGYSYYRGS